MTKTVSSFGDTFASVACRQVELDSLDLQFWCVRVCRGVRENLVVDAVPDGAFERLAIENFTAAGRPNTCTAWWGLPRRPPAVPLRRVQHSGGVRASSSSPRRTPASCAATAGASESVRADVMQQS
jgi:hypothetical protein